MSVLEVAKQTAEVGSTRRVPLGRRVVATLESSQSILNMDRISDEDLQRIRDGDRHVALRQPFRSVGLRVRLPVRDAVLL
jgi:hypothetical protein